MKAYIRSPNYNPGLYCLLWTSLLQPVFNLMRWSFSMQPIKFTVTALIPCGRGSNQSATQFKFWTDFSLGNEVACLCDQRSVSGALSNRKHGLFPTRYFENGPLEPGYSATRKPQDLIWGKLFCSRSPSEEILPIIHSNTPLIHALNPLSERLTSWEAFSD